MINPSTTNRKLLKTGNYTYMLTLPKEWVKVLKWRAKQMVTLELKDGHIVIKDSENK
ncbi:MAG: AbrB/MazE/SpoVT family DNA-binding domain-containing protein [Candidatus Omnitrophica bacterium]|nr:AbrB/MazE/SpoVT family DNA-binding domain-containing protein [Candidatus Omnitrophota bacterium]MCK5259504.1 AbrB/MazE/SpoVT family DNA-binding domain-containing protein [Candidatus Omnitrophota bacterium]